MSGCPQNGRLRRRLNILASVCRRVSAPLRLGRVHPGQRHSEKDSAAARDAACQVDGRMVVTPAVAAARPTVAPAADVV